MYAKYVKRLLDFIISFLAIIILSPILVIIAILIKIDSKGPVFFLQKRLGKDGKVFKIIKFRTMVPGADKKGLKINGKTDKRITKVGRVLRDYGIDEIPQIINILKGDMSLIGPRPPVPYFPYKYEDYSEMQKKRFKVKPGITGLAQIKVRNSVVWDERIKIDISYVDNINFATDFKIFILTIKKFFKKEGLYINNDSKNEKKGK